MKDRSIHRLIFDCWPYAFEKSFSIHSFSPTTVNKLDAVVYFYLQFFKMSNITSIYACFSVFLVYNDAMLCHSYFFVFTAPQQNAAVIE